MTTVFYYISKSYISGKKDSGILNNIFTAIDECYLSTVNVAAMPGKKTNN